MSITRPTIPAYHTVNTRVTLTEFNGIAIDQGIYEQQVLDGTNTDKINAAAVFPLPQAAINLFTNGGMEQWSRGNGPFTATSGGFAPTADGWVMDNQFGATTATSQKETTVTDNSAASVRLDFVAGTAFRTWMDYRDELHGVIVAATFRVNGPAGAFPYIKDFNGVSFGNLSVGTGGWETLIVVRALDNVFTRLEAGIGTQTAGTWYIDNAMMGRTPGATANYPNDKHDEWRRIQARYVQIPFTYSFKAAGLGSFAQVEVMYPTQMEEMPFNTPAFTTLGTRTSVSNAIISSFDDTHMVVDITASAAGYCGIVDGIITVDAGIY